MDVGVSRARLSRPFPSLGVTGGTDFKNFYVDLMRPLKANHQLLGCYFINGKIF